MEHKISFSGVVDGVVTVTGVTPAQIEEADQEVLSFLYANKPTLEGCRYFSVSNEVFAVVKARGQEGVYVTRKPRNETRVDGRDRSISSAVGMIERTRQVVIAKLTERRAELLEEKGEIEKSIKELDEKLLELGAVAKIEEAVESYAV